MNDELLDQPIENVLQPRFANRLKHSGLPTLRALADAIEVYGLREDNRTGLCYFIQTHADAPKLHRMGPKGWGAVLTKLDEAGWNWREHVAHFQLGRPIDQAARRATIETTIFNLEQLLQLYIEIEKQDTRC